ncbi:MAG: carboxypeptidase M32 [Candidatus Thermoplasmatota archaeon]|nr:carboxypeptidase M32 [Candidatus Thermoplasmatota archaeon]
MQESLDFIYNEQKELFTLGKISALLSWDQMTYMPALGAVERSEKTAIISKIIHKKIVSNKLWKHIEILCKSKNFEKLSDRDKNVVSRLKKDVEKARKIPNDFVERFAKVTTLAYPAWQQAREKSDYNIFSFHLQKIVELEKEYCDYINIPGPKYNSLLDNFEEGMTFDKLKKEFDFLKYQLVEILEKIKSSEIYEKQKPFKKRLNIKEQKKLCELIFDRMLLSKDRVRLDVSTHPFTISIGYDDVRITTNFERENPLFSFFSTIHEAGHALYELGLPRDKFKDTVISDAPSLGLQESQSRFWENMIARSKSFWKFFYPILRKTSSKKFNNLSMEKWYRYINQVKPSLIRVEADELTYCLHIILRFEIENDLINDKINVKELPVVWNAKIKEMLDVIPKNDKEGVLQDMHWSGGSFGYFPTYSIGNIYASQLFKKLCEVKQNIFFDIEKGDFSNIINWLREHVHKYGRLMTADDIIKKSCGEGLNSKVFIDYLKDKYFELYEI